MATQSEQTKKEKVTAIDYKKIYEEERKKNIALENKNTELEKICKSFSEKAAKAQETLQNATLEYNARVKYMLDAVRHSYISIQMASDTPQTQGGNI